MSKLISLECFSKARHILRVCVHYMRACAGVCACVYVYAGARARARVRVRVYACTRACIRGRALHARVRVCVCVRACVCVYACAHNARARARIRVCACVRVRVRALHARVRVCACGRACARTRARDTRTRGRALHARVRVYVYACTRARYTRVRCTYASLRKYLTINDVLLILIIKSLYIYPPKGIRISFIYIKGNI